MSRSGESGAELARALAADLAAGDAAPVVEAHLREEAA